MKALEAAVMFDITMVLQVILLDLALGADNSVVIGMAAKNLRPDLQKKAIIYGTIGAIGLRFIMAFAVSLLLRIPFAKTIGGILLLYIGMKLIGSQGEEAARGVAAKSSLLGAVQTIIAADALMSMDNVLGIVGVTNNHWGLLILGMMISVPIIIFGSTVVVKIMNRFPVLIYMGGAILAWAAASMIFTDGYLLSYFPKVNQYLWAGKGLCLLLTIGGGVGGRYRACIFKKNRNFAKK